METPDLDQFDLLARTDDLSARVRAWADDDTPWEPAGRVRALLRRVLGRVETLRVRIEAPLVVATFGGTGVGKSALVNAIVGREVTLSSREQRPTTKRPVLVVHPDVEPEALGLPLGMLDVVRADVDLLRDVAIVDCPDPDTSEAAAAGSNLALLRAIVPHCDVLIVAATQEKYRSARVHEELRDAAAGCRLLFVQTHADADADVRDDWRRLLAAQGYEVPELFFVDSRRALEEQRAGRVPTGDAGRLLGVLRTELAAAERARIRRANVLDLLGSALDRGRALLDPHGPAVETLEAKLAEQRASLAAALADGLRDELLQSRNLWERRLLSAVTANWGFSPFSAALRLYNGLGGVLASMTLYRARSAAQVALIGAAEGVRRLQSWQEERDATDRVGRLDAFRLDETRLGQSRSVIRGYAHEAGLAATVPRESDLGELRDAAAAVEARFLGNATRKVDELIADLAARNSRWHVRLFYETLFVTYLAFVLYRVGRNFFYDSFLRGALDPAAVETPLLPAEFYISAGVFLVLWSGLLVIAFTRRLRRGLHARVRDLTADLAGQRFSGGLFPGVEAACRDVRRLRDRLEELASEVRLARTELAVGGRLGGLAASREPDAARHGDPS